MVDTNLNYFPNNCPIGVKFLPDFKINEGEGGEEEKILHLLDVHIIPKNKPIDIVLP